MLQLFLTHVSASLDREILRKEVVFGLFLGLEQRIWLIVGNQSMIAK